VLVDEGDDKVSVVIAANAAEMLDGELGDTGLVDRGLVNDSIVLMVKAS